MEPKPVRFIGEPVEVHFEQPPSLEKKRGCPDAFVWHGTRYRVVEKLREWHAYDRRGRMAINMRPEHATRATQRGSWATWSTRLPADGWRSAASAPSCRSEEAWRLETTAAVARRLAAWVPRRIKARIFSGRS